MIPNDVTHLEGLATGREQSLFAEDVAAHSSQLESALAGTRIAVVGAAGSIGQSVVDILLKYSPRSLVLIDLNENQLVELIRSLRSSRDSVDLPDDLQALPIGLGSVEFERFFSESEPFDYLFNLAAVKHVRSEKNVYSLIHMIETNVLAMDRFLQNCRHSFRNLFSVSSDKAVNPANLMGASKMLMELVLQKHADKQDFTTARFANVAFSNGSLPYGFLLRIQRKQPIAAPNDVYRYFMSHREAGELCLLAGVLGKNRETYVPRTSLLQKQRLSEIAKKTLKVQGYEPVECSSEDEARGRCSQLIPRKQWPCYFAHSDTTGEKDLEEFIAPDNEIDSKSYRAIDVLSSRRRQEQEALVEECLDFLRHAASDPRSSKSDYVDQLQRVIPGLAHQEVNRTLDQKM